MNRKPNQSKNLDPDEFRKADTGNEKFFLVKVPKYLSEAWMASTKMNVTTDVGTINVPPNLKSGNIFSCDSVEASYTPSKSLLECSNDELPLKHTLKLSRQHQYFGEPYVYTSTPDGKFPELMGQIEFKGDIKPDINDSRYLMIKRRAVKSANTPSRTVQVLDTHHRAYKPKNNSMNMGSINAGTSGQRSSIATELRRERTDKQTVIETVLAAFQDRPNYNIRELTTLTDQPVQYLKEILSEICIYNTRNPNKFTFELKPEYRHY